MSDAETPDIQRIADLLADRAVQGLPEPEARELDRLLARNPGVDAESMDLAAAAADLALAGPPADPMPAAVRAKIEAAAMLRLRPGLAPRTPGREAGLEPPPTSRPAPSSPSTPAPSFLPPIAPRRESDSWQRPAQWFSYTGWAAAAALLFFSASSWWPGSGARPAAPAPAELRAQLLAASSPGPCRAPCTNPADGAALPGDVVWDNERQEGYLRIASLPINDPAAEQYQLWIIDPAQQHPIDGGVFDIPRAGEVVVPITPKLKVSTPTAFAVTIEKPGGVVVSTRQRQPLLAKITN